MKLHFQNRFVLLLLLFVALVPLPVCAVEAAEGSELQPEMVSETMDSNKSETDLKSDSISLVDSEASYQEQLEDIQILLMYLCGIAIFWTFVACGKLLYRFFNMFF